MQKKTCIQHMSKKTCKVRPSVCWFMGPPGGFLSGLFNAQHPWSSSQSLVGKPQCAFAYTPNVWFDEIFISQMCGLSGSLPFFGQDLP
jgi:hypothetical protein